MAGYAAISASLAITGLPEAGGSGDPESGCVASSPCTPTDLQTLLTERLALTLCLYRVAVGARL